MSKVLPKGHASCYSKAFKYTPAASTDVAKTFAKARKRMEDQRKAEEKALEEQSHVVSVKFRNQQG